MYTFVAQHPVLVIPRRPECTAWRLVGVGEGRSGHRPSTRPSTIPPRGRLRIACKVRRAREWRPPRTVRAGIPPSSQIAPSAPSVGFGDGQRVGRLPSGPSASDGPRLRRQTPRLP
eukprot:scaffold2865_cov356-Prasinococcus_capsulatus_cf.AAC.4